MKTERKKVIITGDTSTRDRFKLDGFINSFSSISDVEYVMPPLVNNLNRNQVYDILFGESGDWLYLDYSNIRNVFMWTIIDPIKFKEVAKKYPFTNFYICSKSIIHDRKSVLECINEYESSKYLERTLEEIYLPEFINLIEKSEMLENNLYRIFDNLYYFYLPCSLSSKTNLIKGTDKDIDLTYFGTRENRPGVSSIINQMMSLGYSCVYNEPNKYIKPEDCISYYNRSIITIHEQVGPVYLEYPVRFGEASYCGSKIFSLDRTKSLCNFSKTNPNVPSFESFDNITELVKKASLYIDRYKLGLIKKNKERDYSYDFYTRKIIKLIDEEV